MNIGTLTCFEIKKIFKDKFFIAAFFVLLAVCGILFCTNWGFFGERRTINNHRIKDFQLIGAMSDEQAASFEKAMREKYGEEVFSPFFLPPAQANLPSEYFGEDFNDNSMIHEYIMLKTLYSNSLESYESVLSAAKRLGREALEKQNNYEIRRNLEAIRLYSVERMRPTSPIDSWGVYLFESNTMYLVLLLVLLASASIFTKEKDEGTWLLLHTSKNGKLATLAAKFTALAIIAAGITVLFQAVSLTLIYLNHGLMGGEQFAGYMQEIALLPFIMSTVGYAMLSTACQMLAAIIMAVIFGAVSAFCKSGTISYAVNIVICGVCAFLFLISPRAELLAGPLALIEPVRFFASYTTANIFGYPVLWVLVHIVIWTLISAVLIFAAGKAYSQRRKRL